jgi:hypothetical protein
MNNLIFKHSFFVEPELHHMMEPKLSQDKKVMAPALTARLRKKT